MTTGRINQVAIFSRSLKIAHLHHADQTEAEHAQKILILMTVSPPAEKNIIAPREKQIDQKDSGQQFSQPYQHNKKYSPTRKNQSTRSKNSLPSRTNFLQQKKIYRTEGEANRPEGLRPTILSTVPAQ